MKQSLVGLNVAFCTALRGYFADNLSGCTSLSGQLSCTKGCAAVISGGV